MVSVTEPKYGTSITCTSSRPALSEHTPVPSSSSGSKPRLASSSPVRPSFFPAPRSAASSAESSGTARQKSAAELHRSALSSSSASSRLLVAPSLRSPSPPAPGSRLLLAPSQQSSSTTPWQRSRSSSPSRGVAERCDALAGRALELRSALESSQEEWRSTMEERLRKLEKRMCDQPNGQESEAMEAVLKFQPRVEVQQLREHVESSQFKMAAQLEGFAERLGRLTAQMDDTQQRLGTLPGIDMHRWAEAANELLEQSLASRSKEWRAELQRSCKVLREQLKQHVVLHTVTTEGLREGVEGLKEKVSVLQKGADNFRRSIAGLEREVQGVEGSVVELVADFSTLKNERGAIEGRLSVCEQSMEISLAEQLEALLVGRLEERCTNILESVKSDIAVTEARVLQQVEAGVDTHNTQLGRTTQLEIHVQQLSASMSAVREDLMKDKNRLSSSIVEQNDLLEQCRAILDSRQPKAFEEMEDTISELKLNAAADRKLLRSQLDEMTHKLDLSLVDRQSLLNQTQNQISEISNDILDRCHHMVEDSQTSVMARVSKINTETELKDVKKQVTELTCKLSEYDQASKLSRFEAELKDFRNQFLEVTRKLDEKGSVSKSRTDADYNDLKKQFAETSRRIDEIEHVSKVNTEAELKDLRKQFIQERVSRDARTDDLEQTLQARLQTRTEHLEQKLREGGAQLEDRLMHCERHTKWRMRSWRRALACTKRAEFRKRTAQHKLLLYFDADYEVVKDTSFKSELVSSLRNLGIQEATLEKLEVRLRPGSVIAEVHGPRSHILELKREPLHDLSVQGYKAHRSREDMEQIRREKESTRDSDVSSSHVEMQATRKESRRGSGSSHEEMKAMRENGSRRGSASSSAVAERVKPRATPIAELFPSRLVATRSTIDGSQDVSPTRASSAIARASVPALSLSRLSLSRQQLMTPPPQAEDQPDPGPESERSGEGMSESAGSSEPESPISQSEVASTPHRSVSQRSGNDISSALQRLSSSSGSPWLAQRFSGAAGSPQGSDFPANSTAQENLPALPPKRRSSIKELESW